MAWANAHPSPEADAFFGLSGGDDPEAAIAAHHARYAALEGVHMALRGGDWTPMDLARFDRTVREVAAAEAGRRSHVASAAVV